MDVSVIIVNYNTKKLLENCLQSVFLHTVDVVFEVIVVDNASIDGSQQMIKEKFSKVKLIESEENLGFGRANNMGIEIAQGRYLFLLNSDTELKNNAIHIFFHYMENQNTKENIGAIGSLLIDEEGKYCHSYGMFPSVFNNKLFHSEAFLHGKKEFDKQENEYEVDYVTGADLFVSANLFRKLNGFDNDFFMYYEETDLQFRMKKQGLSNRIIKGPRISHLEGGSIKNVKKKKQSKNSLMTTSLNLFLKKNYTLFQRVCLKGYFKIVDIKVLFNSAFEKK